MGDGSELKDELAILGQHIHKFFVDELRPWAEFFGPVSQPKWAQVDVKKRVSTNVTFFTTNYGIICSTCSAFYILRSPGLLLTLLLSLSMYLYVFMSRRKTISVFDVMIGTREKLIAVSAATMLLLSVTGYILSLQFSGMIGSVICLLHALFRPPVTRAVRNARNGEPELHGGDGDLEGGGGAGAGRGRVNANVNANIRLRTRPHAGGAMGMSMSPTRAGPAGGGNEDLHENALPPLDLTGARLHSHAT